MNARQYLALVRRGRNEWWRYLAALIVIVFFAQVLGEVPLMVLRHFFDYSGMRAFLASTLAVLVALAGLAIAVVFIHQRSMLSLVTPQARFEWRRAFQGCGVWVALGVVFCTLENLLFPGRYRLTFDAGTFFQFAAVMLCLTPLQAAAEELLFRGYLMQALSLVFRKTGVIAFISAALFVLPHVANPEVVHGPLLVLSQYLVMGLLLAVVTLRDGRLELAIGIHVANNLFIGLIVNYDDSVITTDAIFTAGYDPLYSLLSLCMGSVAAYVIFFGWRRHVPGAAASQT